MHNATFPCNLRTRTRPHVSSHEPIDVNSIIITYFVNHQITPDWVVYRIIIIEVISRDFSFFDKMLRNVIMGYALTHVYSCFLEWYSCIIMIIINRFIFNVILMGVLVFNHSVFRLNAFLSGFVMCDWISVGLRVFFCF